MSLPEMLRRMGDTLHTLTDVSSLISSVSGASIAFSEGFISTPTSTVASILHSKSSKALVLSSIGVAIVMLVAVPFSKSSVVVEVSDLWGWNVFYNKIEPTVDRRKV